MEHGAIIFKKKEHAKRPNGVGCPSNHFHGTRFQGTLERNQVWNGMATIDVHFATKPTRSDENFDTDRVVTRLGVSDWPLVRDFL